MFTSTRGVKHAVLRTGHVTPGPGPLEARLQGGGHAMTRVMVGSGGEVGQLWGGEVLIAGVMAVMSPSLSNLRMD